MRLFLLLVCYLFSSAGIAADIHSDPLLAKIHAEARQYAGTTFQTTISWLTVSKKERIDRIVRFDPSLTPPARWQYVSRNGKSPDAKQLKAFAEATKGQHPDGYEVLLKFLKNSTWIPGVSNATTAIYTMVPDDNATVEIDGINMARYLRTQLVIHLGEKPFVRSILMTAPAPFSPRAGTRVKMLDAAYHFDRRSNGDVIPVSERSKADVKIVLFGLQLDDNRVYSDVGKRVPRIAESR